MFTKLESVLVIGREEFNLTQLTFNLGSFNIR